MSFHQPAESFPAPHVAIGPRLEGFGSWDWLGADLARGLREEGSVSVFDQAPPDAEVAIFIKRLAPLEVLRSLAFKTQILYCPVDAYGSAAEIDEDAERLLLCRRIIVHAPRLRPYFQSYARIETLEHHLKYTLPTRSAVITEGPILWVGVRSNLAPLVAWVNEHPLPRPLVVLTNPERSDDLRDPANFGFRPSTAVQLETWSPETHRFWLSRCAAAIDIKGEDFRARHKPAAKALDFLAAGIPLAMNPTAGSMETVRRLGFDMASVEEPEWWLSAEYARQTQDFGRRISAEFAFPRLRHTWRRIIRDVLHEPPTIRETLGGAIPCEPVSTSPTDSHRTKVAIVSLLFNWPSTGGGTVHTAELAKFLTRDGYSVRHLVVQHSGWQVGQVQGTIDWPMEFLAFDDPAWRRETILAGVREALRRDPPDFVILTDSWNFKPRLAEAVGDYPYFVRIAAQELLCPLNNVRLLWDERAGFRSCPRHQLATPETCRQCVRQRGRMTGDLHRAERELAGYAEADYPESLRHCLERAAGVWVVNPAIAENVKPYTQHVDVIPSGFDPARFADPIMPISRTDGRLRIFFAGLIQEPMKGFAVLHAACARLWEARRDFRLQATAEPCGPVDEFTEFVGWQSQAELPRAMGAADIVVCPTIAEEALGRTAVEAMGLGRPVVASRIGGLPFTVLEEATGLLATPGDPDDLARQLARLLDDEPLRERLGAAGRARFESHYTWPVILEQHYRRLLGPPLRSVREGAVP